MDVSQVGRRDRVVAPRSPSCFIQQVAAQAENGAIRYVVL